MRKFLILLMLLLLICTVSLTAVACITTEDKPPVGPVDPVDPPAPPPPPPPPPPIDPDEPGVPDDGRLVWTADDTLAFIGKSIGNGSDILHFKTSIPFTMQGISYTAICNANLGVGQDDKLELYLAIVDSEQAEVFAIIIRDNMLFFGQQGKYFHLENIDPGYMKGLIDTIAPQLPTIIQDAMASLGDINDYITLIKAMLFSDAQVYVQDGVYDITFALKVSETLKAVVTIVRDLGLDGILAGAGVVLPGGSIDELIKLIIIPEFTSTVKSKITEAEDGTLTNNSTSLTVYGADGSVIFDGTAYLTISNEMVDCGIPDGIATYESFGLTQIAFNLNFTISTEKFNLSDMIAMFAGRDVLTTPIVLDIKGAITAVAKIDIDLVDNSRSHILLEFYEGHNITANKLIAGVYYVGAENAFYVKVADRFAGISVPKIKIEGLNLTNLVDQIEVIIKSTIETAIGSILPSQSAIGSMADGKMSNDLVVSLNIIDGKAAPTMDLQAFINSAIALTGLDSYVSVTDKGVTIKINDEFLVALNKLAGGALGTLPSGIGEAIINVNTSANGINDIDIAYTYVQNEISNSIGFNINNITVGIPVANLVRDIEVAIGDKAAYTSNLQDIVFGLLKGVELKGDIDLTLKQGEYNIGALLAKLGITIDTGAIDLGKLIISVSRDTVVQAAVDLQMTYDPNNAANSEFFFELKFKENILCFKQGGKIGFYSTGGNSYLDLSGLSLEGVTLPKLKLVDVDLMTLIGNAIKQIDMSLIIQTPQIQSMADTSDIIGVTLNETTFGIAVTSAAIQALLKSFGMTMILPEFDIKLEMTSMDDIRLDLGFENMVEVDMDITKAAFGTHVDIVMPNFDEYNESIDGYLNQMIGQIKEGFSAELSAKLTLKKGELAIGDFLAAFGINNIPNIKLDVTGDAVLDATIKLGFKYNAESVAGRALYLEIILNESIFGLNSGLLVGLYSTNGKTYIDISNLTIAGLTVKNLGLDIDLANELGKVIDSALAPQALAQVADESGNTQDSINQTTLAIKVSSEFISALLAQFDINVTLPVMDIYVQYDSITGIGVGINTKDVLELTISVKNIALGADANINVNVNEGDYVFNTGDLIKNVIDQVLAGTQLSLDLKLDFMPNTYNLKELLASFGLYDLPDMMLVVAEKTTLNIRLDVAFVYDALNPANSRFSLELILKEKFLFINGSIEEKLIGIYGIGDTTYVDLTGIAINGVGVPKFRLDLNIMQLIADEIGKIDLGGIANGGSVASMADGAQSELEIALSISNDTLALGITSAALAALLANFNIAFELPFDFDLNADIDFSGKEYNLKLDLAIGDMLAANVVIRDLAFNGKINVENLPDQKDFNNADWMENMRDVVIKTLNQVVDHVSMTANVTAEMPVGRYDFAEIVKHLGLLGTQVPNLVIDIVEVQKLNLTLEFNLDYNFNNVAMSEFYLKLYLKEAPVFFSEFVEDASKPMIAIHGKNGNTYIDLSNMVIKGFRLPKVILTNLDLVAMIAAELESSRFVDNMLDSIFGTEEVSNMAAEDYIDIRLSTKAITIKAAASAVAMVLDTIGLKMTLPEISIGVDVNFGETNNDSINDITIEFDMDNFDDGKFIAASMSIKDVKAGEGNTHPSFGFDESGYIASLNQVVKESIEMALSGMEIKLDLDLKIKAGTYDIATLLESFGLTGIPSLNLVFTNDVIANITLRLVTNYDANVAANSRMALEIILNNDLFVAGSDKPVLSKGRLINLFSYNGATYVDLSGITIGNISLPSFKIGIDVMSMIMSLISDIDVDSMLDGLLSGNNGGGGDSGNGDSSNGDSTNGDSGNNNGGNGSVGGEGGSGGNTPDGEITVTDFVNISLLEKQVVLTATSKALAQLIGTFTGSEIVLPKFDVNAFIGGDEIFGLTINFKGADGVENSVELNAQLSKLALTDDIDMTIFEGHADRAAEIDKTTADKIKFIIYDLIKTVDASIELKLDTPQQVLDLTALLNRVMAMQGTQIEIPINLITDNFDTTFKIDIKWNLNFRDHSKSEALIRLYSAGNTVDIRIMYKDNTLYVDLSRLGLIKFKVENFNLTALIDEMIVGLAPELNDSLAAIIEGLLGGGEATDELMTRMATSEAQSIMSEAVAEAQAGDQVIDILDIIMQGVRIQDFIGTINWTSEIFTAALASAGLSLGLPLSLDAEINIPEGYASAAMMIDDIKIGLNVTINKLGGDARPIDWKTFTETLIMPANPSADMTWQDYLDFELQDYGNYKLMSGLDLIMSIFSSMKRSETPGVNGAPTRDQIMYINWTSKTATSNNGSVSISIERLMEYKNQVLNYSAPRGSLLITLYKNFGYGTPTVYIILDVVNGNLNIQGTSNLFSLLGNTGEMVNINIALDLKALLGPLLDPIVGMIPSGALDGSTNDSMADTVAEEAPGLALDINELIKSVNLSVSTVGQLRVNLDLGLESISNMLIDILDDLFMNLDKNILTGGTPNPAGIRYKSVLDSNGAFFTDLYEKWLGPIINVMAGGGLVGGIGESALKSSFSDAVNRLLPLPRFTGGKVQIDLLNGSLSNVFLDTINTNSGTQASEQLNLEIYTKVAKERVEFTMDKITRITDNKTNTNLISNRVQSANVVYDPYDTTYVLENQFSKNARRRKDGYARTYATNDAVTWSVAKADGSGYDNIAINNTLATTLQSKEYADAHAEILADGTLIYRFRAQAFMAAAENDIAEKNKTIYVTVTVLPKGAIEEIKDLIVYENMELPQYVPVQFADGSTRSVKANIINAARPNAGANTIEKNIENPTAGPHVMIDGKAYGVTVRYMDSNITYDSDIVISGYVKDTFTDSMDKFMYVTYASGAIGAVQVTWNIDNLPSSTDSVWITGSGDTTYALTATMHGGTDREQVLTYNVKILSGEVQSISFDGVDNVINLDPLDINLAKDNDAIKALLPQSATIVYKDGHSDVQEIDWSATDMQTIINIATADGGLYVDYLNITNLNGDMKWNKSVSVNIERQYAKYAIIGKNDQGEAIKTLSVDPFEVMYYGGLANVLANEYDFMMEDGTIRRLPALWTYSDITVTFKGGSNIARLTVMPGTSASRTIDVPVMVTPVNVNSLVLPDNTYELAQAGQIIYGGKTIADITPNKMTYRLADGREVEILSKVDFGNVSVNVGQKGIFDATATIGSGSETMTFNFKVSVPDITLDGVAAGSEIVYLDINEFRKQGSSALPTTYKLSINGVETVLPVTIDKSGVEFIRFTSVDGNLVESAGRGGDMKISIGSAAAGNYQETFVKVVITEAISGIVPEVVEVDYDKMVGGAFIDLPTEIDGYVETFTINNGNKVATRVAVICTAVYDKGSLRVDDNGNWTIKATLSCDGYNDGSVEVKLKVNNLPAELVA